MHDIKALRETPDIYDAGWARRGLEPRTAEILAMDSDLRVARTSRMEAEAARNAASKDIGKAKAEKDEATAAKLMQVVAMARVSSRPPASSSGAKARRRLSTLRRRTMWPWAKGSG